MAMTFDPETAPQAAFLSQSDWWRTGAASGAETTRVAEMDTSHLKALQRFLVRKAATFARQYMTVVLNDVPGDHFTDDPAGWIQATALYRAVGDELAARGEATYVR